MKNYRSRHTIRVNSHFLFLTTLLTVTSLGAQPLTTHFTYQGLLQVSGKPAPGEVDLRLELFDAAVQGNRLGPVVTLDDMLPENGLFTAELDFGDAFDGGRRWLEISVRDGSSTGAYTTLSPRQEVAASPYSRFAVEAQRAATADTADDAALLEGKPASDFLWTSGGTVDGSVVVLGNLGVGDPTPGEKLEVAGNILGTGTVCGANGCIGDFSPDPWTVHPDGSIYVLGDVAIGRTDASEKLHVQGSIAYSNNLRHANSTATGEDSVAIGPGNTASNTFDVAIGSFNTASGSRSTALGSGTQATGPSATAMGSLTLASRESATAMGSGTQATGFFSTATGSNTVASGAYSFSMGDSTTASGEYSTSMGAVTEAQAYASLVIGRYNVLEGNSINWFSSDPVFVVGNGTNTSNRANAMTVRKNGNVTIAGSLTQSSDRRLKEEIVPLASTLDAVSRLRGVSFRWKGERATEGRRLGLVAQEVEEVFPELVATDAAGFKAVDYAGLVVPLLRAVQQQQDQILDLRELLCAERPTAAPCGD